MKRIFIFFITLTFAWACKQKDASEYSKVANDPQNYHDVVEILTDVMIHDIFSPPVASRIYNYATLAGYEALIPMDNSYHSMGGTFKGYTGVPKPEDGKEYCYPLASMKAMMTVARGLTFTVNKYDDFEKNLYKKFEDAGVPSDVYDRSMAFGEAVGKHVLGYAKGDNYPQTRGLRYTIKNEPGKWVPTPPQYGDALEPYWMTIRPMVMDSAGQFPPVPVIPYSKDKNSPFWKEVMEVYNIRKTLTKEQEEQAWFWDDNAFVMNVQGHVMFANKKMTPGGHWLAIARTVCKDKKADILTTAKAYLGVSTALHEGFIACWYEKFHSEKVRPETVINGELDTDWTPFLQTPPFPEYTSGHSTISAASAVVLTDIFGDNVTFTDSTEHKFGHGVRTFQSFKQAATDCSYSRMYGGIHYRSGCEEGEKVGLKIGEFVVQKMKK